MNTNFVKILDYSLLPFSLLILGKTLGMYFVLSQLNIDWGIAEFANSLVSTTPVVFRKDLETVATNSNLIMFGVFYIFLGVQILFTFLRNRTDDSKMLEKIMKLNFLNILQKSSAVYTRLIVWLVYLWLAMVIIVIDTLLGRNALWALGLTLIFAVIGTATLLMNANQEFKEVVGEG